MSSGLFIVHSLPGVIDLIAWATWNNNPSMVAGGIHLLLWCDLTALRQAAPFCLLTVTPSALPYMFVIPSIRQGFCLGKHIILGLQPLFFWVAIWLFGLRFHQPSQLQVALLAHEFDHCLLL